MFQRLLHQILPWVIKKVFLLPLVERAFPFIDNPVAKLLTGLALRYIHYQCSTILSQQILDRYCDVIYAEYINLQTMMLCEYKNAIEWCMRYFIDFVNEVIKEATTNDYIDQRMNALIDAVRDEVRNEIGTLRDEIGTLREEVRTEIGTLREEMNNRFDLLENPSRSWQQMLTNEDLTHE